MEVPEAVELLLQNGWIVIPPPARLSPHVFQPHSKYPWFCATCGYGPGEALKHIQAEKDV